MSGVSKITEATVRKSEADLALLKDHAAVLKETMRVLADLRRENYTAHLEAGFTEAQALELVKHDGDLLFR